MKQIIFMFGMHRCGTSVLSHCLFENGYDIGKSENQDKNWQNPNGYFENDVLTCFHNDLLQFNNSNWLNINVLDMNFTDKHVQQYRNIIENEFTKNIILIKDPRLTFCQRFLSKVCEGLYEAKFLFITRNHHECCTSLAKAQNITFDQASQLYIKTHKCIDNSCLVIQHMDIIHNNDKTIEKISKFCNMALLKTSHLIDSNLYRNRVDKKNINYVIATWNGRNKRSHSHINDVLRNHLKGVLAQETILIDQITIMKAESDNYYESYYNIEDIEQTSKIPIVQIDCENYGFSFGQFLKAYEIFTDQFDNYLFLEDDYYCSVHNFDIIISNMYKMKFPDNIGVLTSVVEGHADYDMRITNKLPIHYEGLMLMSTQTLQKMYTTEKWSNNPRSILHTFDNRFDEKINLTKLKKTYVGAFYQVVFSHMFSLSDIPCDDYISDHHNGEKFEHIYWNDGANDCCLYVDRQTTVKTFTELHIKNSIVLPIQLYNNVEETIKEVVTNNKRLKNRLPSVPSRVQYHSKR